MVVVVGMSDWGMAMVVLRVYGDGVGRRGGMVVVVVGVGGGGAEGLGAGVVVLRMTVMVLMGSGGGGGVTGEVGVCLSSLRVTEPAS